MRPDRGGRCPRRRPPAPRARLHRRCRRVRPARRRGGGGTVEGWDFSWLEGRASEERPSWGYAGLLADRLATAQASLDLETGGGQVLDRAPPAAAARGRHRVVAAQPRPGHRPPAPAGRRRRPDRRRRPAAVRGRRLRPRLQPAPRRAAVDRDRARAAPGRDLPRPARRPGEPARAVRVLPGPAATRVLRRRHPEEEAAGAVAAGLASSSCAPRGCGSSSTTSAPWCGSCAR